MPIIDAFGTPDLWSESGSNIYRESLVGIGTTSPLPPLHVQRGSTAPTISAGSLEQTSAVFNSDLSATSGNAQYNRVMFLSSSTGNVHLNFGDESSAEIGALGYDNTTDAMTFRVNSAEAMRINSSGYLGINRSNPSYTLHVEADNGIVFSYGVSGRGGLEYDLANSSLSIIRSTDKDNGQSCGLNVLCSSKRILLTTNNTGANEVLNRSQTDNSICLLSAGDIRLGNTTALNASTLPAMIIKDNSVGIGTESPNAGAILELTTTSKALILPRLTAAQRPTGVNGTLVYNTDDHKLNIFANGSWEEVTSS